jgi:hypothetical protein
MSPATMPLFEPARPTGFFYRPAFVTPADEAALLDAIGNVTFADFAMRGVVARRRVAFFGEAYDRAIALPVPDFLLPLRAALGEWAQVDPTAFAMALINEYRPGSPIGWHRDAPQYDIVAGVSLLSPARMRFRPYVAPRDSVPTAAVRRAATHELVLEPRSAYLMTGSARSHYEHHVPPVSALRYSVTFRTLRSDQALFAFGRLRRRDPRCPARPTPK